MTASHDHHRATRRRLGARYGKFLLRHRVRCALAIGMVTVFAVLGLFQLRFDSEPRTIFQQSNADFAVLEEYFEQFGADDQDVILVLHGSNLFSPEFSGALRAFNRAAHQAIGVETVLSILDVPGTNGVSNLPLPSADPEDFVAARSAAIRHPFLAGQLVSESGQTMLVRIVLEPDDPQTIAKISPIYHDIRRIAARAFSGLEVEVSFAGSVAVRVETLVGVQREFFQIMGLGVLISIAVALLLFRSLGTTLIVAAGPAAAVLWTLGLMGWAGLSIEGISTPLPSIVFVVAFANAVHLMIDIRHSRRGGKSPSQATRSAIGHLGLACLLTSLTTAIGFGSLMLAETTSVQRFGFATAAGSFFGFFSNLTVVPLLASLTKGPAPPPAPAEGPGPAKALAHLAGLILRFSAPITIIALAATALLLWSATQLKSDIIWTETLPPDGEIARAMKLCDDEFGGALQAVVVVEWHESRPFTDPEVLAVLREVESLVNAGPTFRGAVSILNFLPTFPDDQIPPAVLEQATRLIPPAVLKRVLRTDLRRAVVSMHLPNWGAAATRPAVQRMKESLASVEAQHPGFSMKLTGSSVVAAENMTSVIGDLVRSLSFASVTVFLVLTIALRSLKLGLLSIIPNAFPLLLNAGILYVLDKPLQITSVLTFSICLGIAVDDTIHFLLRFLRERRKGRPVRDAITHSLQRVGLALLITTAIITGGFLAATTSSIPGLVFFGALACTALFAALIGDLVILPAMLFRVLERDQRTAQRRRRRAESR